ncbi:MAG: HEAT repeat domain-containing protein [Firmicutes bacterium]|nr:HEAT repeat domain-containing protein [Bacillota bacterium]
MGCGRNLATLRNLAVGLGVSKMAVGTADPLPLLEELLIARSERRLTSPFEMGSPAERASPSAPSGEARTIINIAFPQPEGVSHPWKRPAGKRGWGWKWGWISPHAAAFDYHEVMARVLTRLAVEVPGVIPGGIHVDRTPLPERALAARSGLGWLGRNHALFAGPEGSRVHLGEIASSAELEPDESLASLCGSCRTCIEACPTGALGGKWGLETGRCLSYLTQAKGVFPLELRSFLGSRLYGCDTCQDACPRNPVPAGEGKDDCRGGWGGVGPAFTYSGSAFARASSRETDTGIPGTPVFHPGGWNLAHLPTILTLSPSRFRALFQGRGFAWRGPVVLARNAVISLGNSGDPEAMTALGAALEDRRPIVRGHAAWALGRIGDARARSILEKARVRETEMWVHREIDEALEGSP